MPTTTLDLRNAAASKNARQCARGYTVLLLLGLCLAAPHGVYATSIADSMLAVSNLQITTSGPGTIEFQGPWTAQAFAQANNSLGELQADFNSSVGGATQANAMVTFASAHGEASAVNLTASGDSHGHIPGAVLAQASSVGRGTLLNSFEITGGTGTTTVNFAADINGFLHGFADALGDFFTDVTFTLEVTPDTGPVLFFHAELAGGPNFPDTTQVISEHLTGTLTLAFNTPFSLFAEADAESMVHNVPEPASFAFMLTGVGLLAGLTWQRRRSTTPTRD